MPIHVRELHHAAVCVPVERADEVVRFYQDVLGLVADPSRPQMADVPGAWLWVGPERTTQIHVIGVEYDDRPDACAAPQDEDPRRPHLALAVDDIGQTKEELERHNVAFWARDLAPNRTFVFLRDPAGNMVELHQSDSCTCNAGTAGTTSAMSSASTAASVGGATSM